MGPAAPRSLREKAAAEGDAAATTVRVELLAPLPHPGAPAPFSVPGDADRGRARRHRAAAGSGRPGPPVQAVTAAGVLRCRPPSAAPRWPLLGPHGAAAPAEAQRPHRPGGCFQTPLSVPERTFTALKKYIYIYKKILYSFLNSLFLFVVVSQLEYRA